MWQIDVFGILVHGVEPKVWLKRTSEGFSLPAFTYDYAEDPYLGNQFDGALMPGYQETFGCSLYLLGNLSAQKNSESRTAELICVLEIKKGEPVGGSWVGLDTIALADFSLEKHGELVEQTLVGLSDEKEARDEMP